MYFSGTGVVLHQARRQAGLSQKELAARLGVSHSQVESWERGKALPEREKLDQLCAVLGMTPSELILGCWDSDSDKTEEKLLELVEQTQRLEKQRRTLLGAVLALTAAVLYVLAKITGGNEITDLVSKGMTAAAGFGTAAGILMVSKNLCFGR